MAEVEFIDAFLEHLEDLKLRGDSVVRISPENRKFLRQYYHKSAAVKRTQPIRPPQPQPTQAMRSASATPRSYSPQRQASPQPQAPAVVPAAIDTSAMDWDQLEQTAMQCNRCQLCPGRTNLVFGAGDRAADLMFIGEGPGRDEDLQGIPFVGEAGKLLTKMIEAMQFTRETVYIANIVKCRPPRNRNPEPSEADACLPFLRRQIELVNPKVIVLLGAVPLQFLLGVCGITRNRGKWMKYGDIAVMPTFHPAFLMRKPQSKREVWEDMKQVMARFGMQPPGPSARRSQ